MQLKSLRKIMVSLSLLIGGFSFIISAEVSKSTFLFCLKPEIEPLSIIRNDSQLLVDNQVLQSFIDDCECNLLNLTEIVFVSAEWLTTLKIPFILNTRPSTCIYM